MSYEDFISTFSNGCNLVFSSFNTIANFLMTNYIFITFLGLSLALSFFWFLYNILIEESLEVNLDKYQKKQDLAERYALMRDIKYDYNNSHTQRNEYEAIYRAQINREAYRKVYGGKNIVYAVPSPEWLDEELIDKPKKLSKKEQKEFDDLIDNF